MPNNYFSFKQFTIHQDRCAMKVGTDGVLLGAWVDTGRVSRILDIGTGTGLLALMLAQRCGAMIDAVEIDGEAARQASENANASPWKNRINIIHCAIQDFNSQGRPYDLVIANPPYFSKSMHPPDTRRRIARHDHELDMYGFISSAVRLLSSSGRLAIIQPSPAFPTFTGLAGKKGLYPIRITGVKPTPTKDILRVLAEFSFTDNPSDFSELVIEENGRHNYSNEYRKLTKPFYLEM